MSEQNTPTEFFRGDPDADAPPSNSVTVSSAGTKYGTCGLGMAASSRKWEDLSTDMLIRGTVRTPFQGSNVPVLGGIALLARLGQGGMGKVYFGFHLRLEREVAVKVVWSDMAERHPELIPRFKREARLASKVVSPHLVAVLDVDEKDGLHYMVMEYVHGLSAAGYLKEMKQAQRAGLPEGEALSICLAASRGLAAAHQKGIIHRDIKPDNILLPRGEVGDLQFDGSKLADLGIARQEASAESNLTMPSQFMGTPGYAAPEQCGAAHSCGKPADVFGMGATLYALLAGREPFSPASEGSYDDELVQVIHAVKSTPHAPIRSLRPDVNAATAQVIDKCLEKKPELRFQDAKEMVAALERALETAYGGSKTPVRDAEARGVTEQMAAPTELQPPPKPEDFNERPPIRPRGQESDRGSSEPTVSAEVWRSKTRGAKKSGGWVLAVSCVLVMALGAAAYGTYASRGYLAALFHKPEAQPSDGALPPKQSDAKVEPGGNPKLRPPEKVNEPVLPVEPAKKEPVVPPAPPPEPKADTPVKPPAPNPEKSPVKPPVIEPATVKPPVTDPPPAQPPEKAEAPLKTPEKKEPVEPKPVEPVKPTETKVEPPAKDAPFLTLDLGNDVKLELVRVAPGTFKMGSPANEEARDDSEIQHDVTVGKAFYMGKFPITQAQYQAVMAENPSEFKGADLPVESVSWFDAVKFCEKVKGQTQKSVRLPTEAQWEYACRAGTTSAFSTGATISTDDANYDGESKYDGGKIGEYRRRTTPVATFKPNAIGLHDMHGNVWQWCQDFYSEIYYRNSEAADPAGPVTGTTRVSRGGAWNLPPRNARSASRNHNLPSFKAANVGFRIVVVDE